MGCQDDQIFSRSWHHRCSHQTVIEKLEYAGFKGFILRDDLLGGLLNGSKHRKYSGLFNYLKKLDLKRLIIPGSIASNHLLMASAYAKQTAFTTLVITKKPYGPLKANAQALVSLLKPSEIIYNKEPLKIAKELATDKCFIIPLGGYHKEAAISCLSLGYEIMQFYQKHPFATVVLDAGTGLQAASALCAMQEKGYRGHAYVITMGKLQFSSVLEEVADWTQKQAPTFTLKAMAPLQGALYGSRDAKLEAFGRDFYAKTAIKLDPLYNLKSFYTLFRLLEQGVIQGPYLIVHSGGTLSCNDLGIGGTPHLFF